MSVTLLDGPMPTGSPPHSPDFISLYDPTPVRRLTDSYDSEDVDGILVFELDQTQPAERRPLPRTDTVRQVECSSSLCPSAQAYVPYARADGTGISGTATTESNPRIRVSGTSVVSQLLVDLGDSGISSHTPLLLPEAESRLCTSTVHQLPSPRLLSPSSSAASSSPSTPYNISRSPSTDSLPDLELDDEDELENTPPTSTSCRATPRVQGDDSGIIVTSEEDIARLFTFDFKPATFVGEDKTLVDLSDIGEKGSESGALVETYKEHTGDLILLTQAQRDKPKSKCNTTAFVSVQAVEDLLIDSSANNPSGDRSPIPALGKGAAKRIDKTIQPSGTEGKAEGKEDLLVDLSDSGMGRNSPDRFFRGAFNMAQQSPVRFTGPSSSSRPGPSRRAKNAIDAEGQLIDIGVPFNRNRDNADSKTLRHRMGLNTPSTPKSARTRAPPVSVKGIPAVAERYQAISPYHQLISRKSPRHGIPQTIRDPGAEDPLQHTLIKAWQATEPSKAKRSYVLSLLEELSVLVNQKLAWAGSSSVKGKRRFEVDVFGSVSWGGETGASGDLDLVILDLQMPYGYHPDEWRVPAGQPVNSSRTPRTPFQHLPPVYRLRALKQALDDLGMRETFAIVSATTPIVKFKDPSAKMECDVNVNDLGGWYNSSLILHYCLISPYVLRPMVYALKLWARAFNLNDPSGANGPPTMSSYCLTLMAIAYLQVRGVLPNLQSNVRAKVPNDNITEEADTVWIGWGKDQGTKAHVGFDRSPPAGWKSAEPGLTAAQALRDFFSFFNKQSNPKSPDAFQYDSQIVSIVQGGVAARAKDQGESNREEAKLRQQLVEQEADPEYIKTILQQKREEHEKKENEIGKGDNGIQPRQWEDKVLVVQDPFLWNKNCAAGMSKDGWKRFCEAIEHTDKLLKETGVTLDQMIVNPNPDTASTRTKTPRRGGPFGRRGGTRGDRGKAGAGAGAGGRGGTPSSSGPGDDSGRSRGHRKPAKSPSVPTQLGGRGQTGGSELIST